MHDARWPPSLGLKDIPATIEGLPTDIRNRAFELNQHGWPLSIAERKAQAQYLKQRYPELSDREIARRCGLSPTTVSSAVQNGQADASSRVVDHRRELARSTVRFYRTFAKLQEQIATTFIINPNRPKSVATVLRDYYDENTESLADFKKCCMAVSTFMRDVAREL